MFHVEKRRAITEKKGFIFCNLWWLFSSFFRLMGGLLKKHPTLLKTQQNQGFQGVNFYKLLHFIVSFWWGMWYDER